MRKGAEPDKGCARRSGWLTGGLPTGSVAGMVESHSRTDSWLVSPRWDAFWMFSGLWLVALIGLSSLFGFAHPAAGAVFLAGFFLLWGGHLLSPILCVWA